MGIAFLTQKAEKFKQRKDKAFEEELGSGNLLSGLPESVEDLFRCISTAGDLPEVGTPVLLYDKGDQIAVILKNRNISKVMTPDAGELKKMMAHTGAEVFTAQVVEVQPLSKSFIVQLTIPRN